MQKKLKDCKERDPKAKKQTVTAEKCVTGTALILPALTRRCLGSICGPRSLLHILIKNKFSRRTAHHFHCGYIAERWQIAVLPPNSPPLNLLDYGTCGILQAKGNATAHPKFSFLKQTMYQLWSAKVRRYCGETAAGA
jgi:hypothetical protein